MRIVSEAQCRQPVTIMVDGVPIKAHLGETIAGALLAEGRRTWRHTRSRNRPRGLFCGMGVCFDCLVKVDGRPYTRACMTSVVDGMVVDTYHGAEENTP